MTGRKRMHLAVRSPGGDPTTARSGPRPAEFAARARLARTAERGLFDFLLLAGEPLPWEHGAHDPDTPGCPEPLTVLNALAAVTGHLGLAATAGDEPYELARRLATLDHLSGGRAAWHVDTSADAFTGRRRVVLGERSERYARAAESVAAARHLWDSWPPDGTPRPRAHQGRYFDIEGAFTLPRPPQGHPVVIHGDDSAEGREFAASSADVLLTRHRTPEAARALRADVRRRLAGHGRGPDGLRILPGVTVVLGDTDAEARERAGELRRQQVSPRAALLTLERIWGADLSAYDPDGPLPDTDPVPGPPGREGSPHADRIATAGKWRALAQEKGLSIRQLVIETSAGPSFVGTPGTVAARLDAYVARGAADGFVLVPSPVPDGLDAFVDRVVPLLQERGVFRTEYEGGTLRSHLGLTRTGREGSIP
ncbi:NtaA/DmoA family FMN-dependent monooxygenase [Streptomyces sp. NPDC004783]|uniref:NtaA/DmoA family FMN-dependent monooxygenase n=1 Tax=Streptomyces sp. NPDC004783 TaxID=3154459 RepID=UPI0033A64C26